MMMVAAIENISSDSEIEINFRSIPFSGNRPAVMP